MTDPNREIQLLESPDVEHCSAEQIQSVLVDSWYQGVSGIGASTSNPAAMAGWAHATTTTDARHRSRTALDPDPAGSADAEALQLPSGRRAQLERTCDQFQQVMGSLAMSDRRDEEQTLQLRELLSAIEELHLCLEPLEAPCSDLVARLP